MAEPLPEPPEPPEPLPVPPPELVQLDMPAETAAISRTRNSALKSTFRRRPNASGKSSSPHSIGSMRHPAGLAMRADPDFPVEI